MQYNITPTCLDLPAVPVSVPLQTPASAINNSRDLTQENSQTLFLDPRLIPSYYPLIQYPQLMLGSGKTRTFFFTKSQSQSILRKSF